jgi:hypothetical protein
MNDSSSFTKLVPGFDFLQGLVKNAGAALPGIGQWVAPTIDPAEIEKRIEELRTVQFWLEQNARMLGATIQALEVQRMTLSTLKTMNVQMEGLRDSLKIRVPEPASPEPAPAAPAAAPPADAAPEPAKAPAASQTAPPAGVVDPMQWWGALTKQFGQLATAAMTEGVAVASPSKSSKPSTPAAATTPAAKKVAAKKKAAARRKVAAKKAAPRP